MSWAIVPQEIKEKGKVVGHEDCKQVKFFPFEKGGATLFGSFKNKKGDLFPVLKVLVSFKGGKEHKLIWSNYQNQGLATGSAGKFTSHQPTKMKHPTYKVKGRYYEDTLSAKVEVAGDKREWESHKLFEAYLVKRMGKPVADRIMGAFAVKMVEVMKEMEAAKKKAA